MTAQWASLGDFIAMGGYGGYVWGSYAVTLLVLAADALMAARRRRRALAAGNEDR